MYFDTVADYLTRIRNAQMAQHRMVEIPASNLKKRITEILYDKGYILKYKFEGEAFGGQGKIMIALKYDGNMVPVMKAINRASKPGKRVYKNSKEIPHVLNGLGVAIISTSKGVMTDKEARNLNVGGEILCEVY
ncbi:MAG: 30S ribosomal protein S8 [Chitinophagales bacterium]|jgi:small subunit ribosomal protein S8|tara:strand:- start:27437 stop:27838 length:402 start_codon:yes stop_codon:yes gene_type:complete